MEISGDKKYYGNCSSKKINQAIMESITFNYPNDMNFDDEIGIEKEIIKGRRNFHSKTN